MSGTRSILALEKEDGIYSVQINYDSNLAFFYLYFLHNKREDWEYIIKKGQVSSIGFDLRKTKDEAIFKHDYSTFYSDVKNRNSHEFEAYNCKDLKEFEKILDSISNPPFIFFMNKKDETFVASDYYKPDGSYGSNSRTLKDLIPIKEYIKKYIDKEHLQKIKDDIVEKRFKTDTFFIECDSKEEQEERYNDMLIRKGSDYHIFKEDNGFNIYCIYKKFTKYHNKIY